MCLKWKELLSGIHQSRGAAFGQHEGTCKSLLLWRQLPAIYQPCACKASGCRLQLLALLVCIPQLMASRTPSGVLTRILNTRNSCSLQNRKVREDSHIECAKTIVHLLVSFKDPIRNCLGIACRHVLKPIEPAFSTVSQWQ